MITIAIVEDNEQSLHQLNAYIERYGLENQQKFRIYSYSDGESLFNAYYESFDAIFLDIVLPGKTGLEIAEKLREMDSQVIIVFVTNLLQYAVNGYSVNALDYILKPIAYPALCLTLQKLTSQLRRQTNYNLLLTSNDSVRRLSSDSIYYVDVTKHNVTFHMAEDMFTIRSSLRSMEELLLKLGFSKCSNRCLVNLKYVTAVSKNSVTVANHILPISRRSYAAFLRDLMDCTHAQPRKHPAIFQAEHLSKAGPLRKEYSQP